MANAPVVGKFPFVTVSVSKLTGAPEHEPPLYVVVSVELGSRGTVEITTLPPMMLNEFAATLKGQHRFQHGEAGT
jgi:uncharacterized protein with GYD domain